jgi:hypothetical protein
LPKNIENIGNVAHYRTHGLKFTIRKETNLKKWLLGPAMFTLVVGKELVVHVVFVSGQDDRQLVAVVLGGDLNKVGVDFVKPFRPEFTDKT